MMVSSQIEFIAVVLLSLAAAVLVLALVYLLRGLIGGSKYPKD